MTTKNLLIEVEKLRQEIERVRAEIEWVEKSPLPKADWKARVAAWANHQSEAGSGHATALRFLRLPASQVGSSGGDFLRVHSRAVQQPGTGAGVLPIEISLAPLMAWLYGDDLVRRLHAFIDAEDYVPGPPLEERASRRADLLAELRDLEIREEAVITAAEDEMVHIGRRADADPAIVLDYSPDGVMAPALKGTITAPTVVA